MNPLRTTVRLVTVTAVAVATASIAIAGASGASTTKSPTCDSVSVSTVRHGLGGAPTKPKMQTSSGVLICHYGTVDLIYLLHRDKTLLKADEASNKGTSVANLGNGAFTYETSSSKLTTLEVLKGTVVVIVSGSPDSTKQIESFAKTILPLI
jgi:hypothetical protein